MKARDLLSDVLVEIGANDVLDTMSAEQAQICLRALNRMIDGWQTKSMLVYAVTEVVATVSTASATIGPSMQFNCPTPTAIQRGSYFLRGGQSFPIDVIERAEYNSIQLKGMAGDTSVVYFDRAAGLVRFYPVTTAEYHLQVLARLPAFADLDTVYTLPDGYENAIHLSLRERLPRLFNLPVDPKDVSDARGARRALKVANADVPTLQVPSGSGRLNILTNQTS